jgi:hypothetical protein
VKLEPPVITSSPSAAIKSGSYGEPSGPGSRPVSELGEILVKLLRGLLLVKRRKVPDASGD